MSSPEHKNEQRVVITGIKVPLMDLFWLMVKWTLASLLPWLCFLGSGCFPMPCSTY